MPTRWSRMLASMLVALVALASALAETAPLRVTYYYLPG